MQWFEKLKHPEEGGWAENRAKAYGVRIERSGQSILLIETYAKGSVKPQISLAGFVLWAECLSKSTENIVNVDCGLASSIFQIILKVT